MTVLWERPSRTVRCSKYNGRTAGTGAVADRPRRAAGQRQNDPQQRPHV